MPPKGKQPSRGPYYSLSPADALIFAAICAQIVFQFRPKSDSTIYGANDFFADLWKRGCNRDCDQFKAAIGCRLFQKLLSQSPYCISFCTSKAGSEHGLDRDHTLWADRTQLWSFSSGWVTHRFGLGAPGRSKGEKELCMELMRQYLDCTTVASLHTCISIAAADEEAKLAASESTEARKTRHRAKQQTELELQLKDLASRLSDTSEPRKASRRDDSTSVISQIASFFTNSGLSQAAHWALVKELIENGPEEGRDSFFAHMFSSGTARDDLMLVVEREAIEGVNHCQQEVGLVKEVTSRPLEEMIDTMTAVTKSLQRVMPLTHSILTRLCERLRKLIALSA